MPKLRYMLDTNVVSELFKKAPSEILKENVKNNHGTICISSIVYAELIAGYEGAKDDLSKQRTRFDLFMQMVEVLPFIQEAAEEAGKIKGALKKQGTPIGPMDSLIAGHAKQLGLIVVTRNTREFNRVEGLSVVDWHEEQDDNIKLYSIESLSEPRWLRTADPNKYLEHFSNTTWFSIYTPGKLLEHVEIPEHKAISELQKGLRALGEASDEVSQRLSLAESEANMLSIKLTDLEREKLEQVKDYRLIAPHIIHELKKK